MGNIRRLEKCLFITQDSYQVNPISILKLVAQFMFPNCLICLSFWFCFRQIHHVSYMWKFDFAQPVVALSNTSICYNQISGVQRYDSINREPKIRRQKGLKYSRKSLQPNHETLILASICRNTKYLSWIPLEGINSP